MTLNRSDSDAGTPRRRGWPVIMVAVAFFGLLATLPLILPALHLQLHPAAPSSRYGVALTVAPRSPQTVRVPDVAQPIDPLLPAAARPATNPARETATLSADDQRLRVMLHDAASVYQPEVVPVRGSLPTLILTAGQGPYTAATLVQYGALVMLPHQAALLLDNVYVSTNATLSLGGPTLRTLYLDSGSGGFTSIVGWDGNLAFHGTSAQPMTIMGWNRAAGTPAADLGSGRPYIREAGGNMTLTDVRATSLGFWSGRTSGVAWTGLSAKQSTGGATASTFTGETYGAFVSRGSGLTFRDDLFELNALDGLHIHRYSQNTTVVSSSAVRNGGSGFAVAQATQNTRLEGDLSERNSGDGFFLNGRPLATGASASGGSIAPGSGTTVEDSAASANGKIGILAEGGTATVIKGDQVSAAVTAIAVRDAATDTVVTGNTVGGHPSSGFAVGPQAPGTVLAGNAVDGARTAFLIRTAGRVEMDTNLVTNATVFGVSSRGASSVVTGTGNTLAGTGFRATDAREGAPMPALYATNTAGWTVHTPVTFLTYLEFHPLAAMWLGVVALGALAFAWSRMRRIPSHPYPASTQWAGDAWAGTTPETANAANAANAAKDADAAGEAGEAGAGDAEPPVASRSYAAAGRGTGAARWAAPGSPWHASEPFQRGNPASPARSTREGRS
jgi:Right handed beta helix region